MLTAAILEDIIMKFTYSKETKTFRLQKALQAGEVITSSVAAKRFGIKNLIATEPEENHLHEFTGKVKGLPNFQHGKVTHVENWLESLGFNWGNLENSIFYSDSMNDLPLLEKVKTPIATNPDPRLESLAKERSWKIINLFS